MKCNNECPFMPEFLVCDGFTYFPAFQEFIDGKVENQDHNYKFNIKEQDGKTYYPMLLLKEMGWFTAEQIAAFSVWAEKAGIKIADGSKRSGVTWYTKTSRSPSEIDLPEFARTIGISDDGDFYVAMVTLDFEFPEEGLAAKCLDHLGVTFVCVQDWAKLFPEEFKHTVLENLLVGLASKENIIYNPFG